MDNYANCTKKEYQAAQVEFQRLCDIMNNLDRRDIYRLFHDIQEERKARADVDDMEAKLLEMRGGSQNRYVSIEELIFKEEN
jgi:hypothetical protein